MSTPLSDGAYSPGQIVEFDYRDDDVRLAAAEPSHWKEYAHRVVQWNIERGYKLPAIIEALRRMDADIVILQELDVGCKRTNGVNVPQAIARALHAHLIFVAEFEELDSPLRKESDAGGEHAVHGNAILSTRMPLQNARCFPHSVGVDWERCGEGLKEPRRGRRAVLTATIDTSASCLHLYSLHLEIFCGMLMRARQLGDAMHDVRIQRKAHDDRGDTRSFHAIIGGDLNTIAHSIVRFSPKYATDRMRFLSLGETEAEWIHRNVLDPIKGPTQNPLVGLTDVDHARMSNRGLYFYDPFDIRHDITLDNPAYNGWVTGKLDWLLCSNVTVRAKWMEDLGFNASDHRALAISITISGDTTPKSTCKRWQQPRAGQLWRIGGQATLLTAAVGAILFFAWLLIQLFS